MSELQRLRDRVAELEELLGLNANLPAVLFIRGPRVGGAARELLGLLLKASLLRRSAAYAALYGTRPEADQPEEKILDVHISALRKALPPGVQIITIWSTGWLMTEESKAVMREKLAEMRGAR